MARIPTPYDGMTLEQINMLIANQTAAITDSYMKQVGNQYNNNPATYARAYIMASREIGEVVRAQFADLIAQKSATPVAEDSQNAHSFK